MRVSDTIIKPIVTERTMAMQNEGNYVFEVNMKTSKGAVSKEIERLYNVKVDSVRVMIMPGKKRRILKTRRFTKTKKWKKAVVKLKEGQKLELVGK